MHARFLSEASETGRRMAWMIAIVTVMGAAFGAAVLKFATRTWADAPRGGGIAAAQKRRNPEADASNTRET